MHSCSIKKQKMANEMHSVQILENFALSVPVYILDSVPISIIWHQRKKIFNLP